MSSKAASSSSKPADTSLVVPKIVLATSLPAPKDWLLLELAYLNKTGVKLTRQNYPA
jgi:hypothetical protein